MRQNQSPTEHPICPTQVSSHHPCGPTVIRQSHFNCFNCFHHHVGAYPDWKHQLESTETKAQGYIVVLELCAPWSTCRQDVTAVDFRIFTVHYSCSIFSDDYYILLFIYLLSFQVFSEFTNVWYEICVICKLTIEDIFSLLRWQWYVIDFLKLSKLLGFLSSTYGER